MKHMIGFNRLSRKASHRRALLKNMITSLFKHERITTTKAKALAVRQVAEKMITKAKVDSVHNRRMIGRRITDESILFKLFTDIGPRFEKRPGGYTRVLKLGPRFGDAAEMVILELVDKKEPKETEKKSGEDKPAKVAKVAKVEKAGKVAKASKEKV